MRAWPAVGSHTSPLSYVYFFRGAVTYLPYLVYPLVVIPCASPIERACARCVGLPGVFHTMFLLELSLSFCTLWALGALWFLGRGSCLYACVCLRGPFGALFCNINILGLHTYAYVAGLVWGIWAPNILVRHTIMTPWSVAIPYALSFSSMFLLDLVSVFMYLVGAWCLWTSGDIYGRGLCMYACFTTCAVVSLLVFVCGVVPLAPSFTTYLVSRPTHM